MSIPTNAELLVLLERLATQTADDLESQWLDFKPWYNAKDDMKVATEYAICFANGDGGVIVFGVADKTRGRMSAIHGAKDYDLDVWRRSIYAATNPNLNVEVEELTVPEETGKLLVVRVPKGISPPYGTTQGLYKIRVGKNCMPLNPAHFAKMQISSGAIDWSGHPAEGVAPCDLDTVEIARARNILRRINPNSELLKLDDNAFLIGLGAIRNGKVTHTGFLLFGREQMLVVSSPGGFIAGITPLNILRHEPMSRNRVLAEAFEKLLLVERAGIGRRRIFIPMLSYGKQMPQYETDGMRVILRLFNGSYDQRMAALVVKWKQQGMEIDLDNLIVLSFLREHAFIDTLTAAELLQLPRDAARAVLDQSAQPRTGILERRGKTKAAAYYLTKNVSKDLLGKTAYTKTKGLEPIRYAEMVKFFLVDHDSITPQECRELLGLGESHAARVEASRYLKQWSGENGFLRREGKPPKVIYYLREKR